MTGSLSMNGLRFTDQGVSLRVDLLGRGVGWLGRKYPGLFLKEIALGKLLTGGEQGNPSARYARVTGDLFRPSRPIAISPHAQLLEAYRASGEDVLLPESFEATPYYKNAAECIELYGSYFTIRDPKNIIVRARKYCQMFDGTASDKDDVWLSPPGSHPIVRRISFSDCYEIVDGHHRLADASVKGLQKYVCVVQPSEPVLTPVQQMVMDSNWTNGRRELYQPISAPELATWPVLRQCTDRLEMMTTYLAGRGINSGSYLDIGCSYGWFVRAMAQHGFQAFGVDRDKAAVAVGRLAYSLDGSANLVSDITGFLGNQERRYDVVSCFSVLHHFVQGLMCISAAEFIRKVDAVTGSVMFLDTGECHEGWFAKSLAGWDAEFIGNWLKEHTSFTRIENLGTDSDNVGPYQNQYQRHLFVCSRDG